MHEAIGVPLEAWGSFYVIVGSSAGALTGLQFVVITLIAQAGRTRGQGESIAAFGTPNVVHFCAALLISSILSVPWGALWHVGLAIAVCGILGIIYSVVVMRRARRQREYRPVFEDWLWHAILPVLAYASLFVAGMVLLRDSADALLVIGAATLLLVFIGIHNAWDTVTYLVMLQKTEEQGADLGTGDEGKPRAGGGVDADVGTEPARIPGSGVTSAPGVASASAASPPTTPHASH